MDGNSSHVLRKNLPKIFNKRVLQKDLELTHEQPGLTQIRDTVN